MTSCEYQEQIAKEICIKLLDLNLLYLSDVGTKTPKEFNAQLGDEVGTLYQSILQKVCETNNY